MKKTVFIFALFAAFSCNEKPTVYLPEGAFGEAEKNEMAASKERAKNLNKIENQQIKDWVSAQQEKFYPTHSNYWVNIENFDLRPKNPLGQRISYEYELYAFDREKIYPYLIENQNVTLGKIDDISAVADALLYLQKGEAATLLVPSASAFGTYGDGKKIPHDMPLIIKLKITDKF